MTSAPLVSVVVPTFNAAPRLSETLDSVLNQTFSNFELLIVDDASTDDTATVVERYQSLDPRVCLIKLKQNSNRPAVPRNVGIAHASGRYVAFLDHDDVWYPYKLQRQIQVMERYPEVVLVHGAMLEYPNRRSLISYMRLPVPRYQRSGTLELRQYNRVQCSSVLAKRKSLVEVGGFDEDPLLRAVEDYDLWLRLSRVGDFLFTSEILGLYRIDPRSTAALENMSRRLDHMYAAGLIDERLVPTLHKRVARKILGIPSAIYLYAFDAHLRRRLSLAPRTY